MRIDNLPVTGSAIIFNEGETATIDTALGPINFRIVNDSATGTPECVSLPSGRDFELRNYVNGNIAQQSEVRMSDGTTQITVRICSLIFGSRETGVTVALSYTELPR